MNFVHQRKMGKIGVVFKRRNNPEIWILDFFQKYTYSTLNLKVVLLGFLFSEMPEPNLDYFIQIIFM